MTIKNHKSLLLRLATVVILSSVFCCQKGFADGGPDFYYNLAEIKPIQLDVSQKEKIETTIPFNLRSFSESEYFSSQIDNDIPVSNKVVEKHNEVPKVETSSTNLLMEIDDFFAPIPEDIVHITETEDTSYASSVNTTEDNPDLEGRVISGVTVLGLRTLKPELVIEHLNTHIGSLFNADLLQQDLQKIYAVGFFTDSMEIEPTLNPDGTVKLTFVLEENVLVNDISIMGNTVISTNELMLLANSLKKHPQNLNEINKVIDKINNCYHDKGYILASVQSVDDNEDGVLSFSILEGIINSINISGNEKTKDYVIKRNIITQPGTVYNEDYLKKDLAKVYTTQIFDAVDRIITPSDEQPGSYDVTIAVKEKSTDSISLGGGLDSGLGVFGSIGFKDDNFLGRAQRVSLSGIIGSGVLLSDSSIKNHMNYGVDLDFFEPYFLNADNSLRGKMYWREMGSWQIPLAIERRIGISAGVEHKVSGYEHLSTTFSAGVEHIHLKEGDFNRISQLYSMRNLDIARRAEQLAGGFFVNFTPGVRYSTLDNNEIPREGIVARAQFNEALGVSNMNHTNGRLSGVVTKYIPVFKKSSLSFTARGGIKVHGDNMPEIMAYRLGGPYNIRGYKLNGVGSGDSFLMGSAELATPIPLLDRLKWEIAKNIRFTFFVDAGKVFDPTITSYLYDRPLSAISAGVGVKVFIPGVGPISVDYGLPVTNTGHYGSKHGYFTFGTGYMYEY